MLVLQSFFRFRCIACNTSRNRNLSLALDEVKWVNRKIWLVSGNVGTVCAFPSLDSHNGPPDRNSRPISSNNYSLHTYTSLITIV